MAKAFSDEELLQCRKWVDNISQTAFFGNVPVEFEQKMKDMANRFLATIDLARREEEGENSG